MIKSVPNGSDYFSGTLGPEERKPAPRDAARALF